MIEKEKKVKKKEKILKVVEAFQQDVGWRRIRIDFKTRTELDLNIGDTVELEGTKKVLLIVWRAHPSDEGKKMACIDKYTREEVGADIGQRVTIRRTTKQLPADKQMKRQLHDDKLVVAKVDKEVMKEIKDAMEIYDSKIKKIDTLITTMSRLEKDVWTINKAIWKTIHKNVELKDYKHYSYNSETGEVTIEEVKEY